MTATIVYVTGPPEATTDSGIPDTLEEFMRVHEGDLKTVTPFAWEAKGPITDAHIRILTGFIHSDPYRKFEDKATPENGERLLRAFRSRVRNLESKLGQANSAPGNRSGLGNSDGLVSAVEETIKNFVGKNSRKIVNVYGGMLGRLHDRIREEILKESTLTPIAFNYEYGGSGLPTLIFVDGRFAGKIKGTFEYGRDYQDIGYAAEILGRDVSFITQGMGSWTNQNLKDCGLGIRRKLLKEKMEGVYVFGPEGKPFGFYVPSEDRPQFYVHQKGPQRFKK